MKDRRRLDNINGVGLDAQHAQPGSDQSLDAAIEHAHDQSTARLVGIREDHSCELEQRQQVIETAIARGDYRRAFGEAAKFGPSVDKFFADVFVMVDDVTLRTARLGLMKRLESLILTLGDISEIVAERQA